MARKRAAKKNATPQAAPPPAAPGSFASSIVGFEYVDPKTIRRNPLNFRQHPPGQKDAMRDALHRVGFVQAIVANQRNRHLIDGEMRLDLAIENAEEKIPCLWVDLDPAQERLALATMNPIGELAVIDPEQLHKLLEAQSLEVGGLSELMSSLNELAAQSMVPTGGAGVTKKSARNIQTAHTIKLVLAVPEIAIFERAVGLCRTMNRGEAVMMICKHFIESQRNGATTTEGQHDARAQGRAPAELAEALAAGASRS